MNFIKHFVWFIVESKKFLGCSYFKVFKDGGLTKGIQHAKTMCEWDKMTSAQKEAWYLSGEGRTFEI
jgi:hypothetical protein